jgi:hypothetical protein
VSLVRHVVPAPLRPFVAAAHGYRSPALPTGLHRGLPSRHLTLVVELAAPLRVSGTGPAVAAHAVLGGLHTRPALIDATRPQEGLQYALTPLAAGALLGLPAAELAERTVDLADVLGRAADRLVDDLAAAPGWAERFTGSTRRCSTGSAGTSRRCRPRCARPGACCTAVPAAAGSRTWPRTSAGVGAT